ncbi:angiopoietin-related protein 7 [Drosophila rhopaloa]|uniref:Fibrinogen C-terminal domain-containing protein n=1 Tax=Drosophila rhopaloa TaxID=1041015 RepID=A0ABM5GTX3_DRORH|nr:angiopoietin-related protein 7 [Drosophila rhopaloa]
MNLSLIFLLAWSSVFLGGTHTLSRIRKSDIGLKTLEELILIRKTLDRQALRLRGVEINLHRVLSRVILLSDGDVQSLRTTSSKEDHLKELSLLFAELFKRLDQDENRKDLNDIAQQIRFNPLESSLNASALKDVSKENVLPKVDFYQPAKSDCYELDEDVRVDGVYKFLVAERNEIQRDFYERYCAFATDGPAWTVIQNRGGAFDPPENFNRSWDEYRAGFGNLSRDFWFGNEFTHKILYRDDHKLRVELQEEQEPMDWAEYSVFRLDSEGYNYQLFVEGGFRGSLPDALQQHNQTDFSTYDRRSDLGTSEDSTCGESYGGGWWLGRCTPSNLNGEHGVHQRLCPAIIWMNWRNGTLKPKNSRMMIRPVSPIPGDNFDED